MLLAASPWPCAGPAGLNHIPIVKAATAAYSRIGVLLPDGAAPRCGTSVLSAHESGQRYSHLVQCLTRSRLRILRAAHDAQPSPATLNTVTSIRAARRLAPT